VRAFPRLLVEGRHLLIGSDAGTSLIDGPEVEVLIEPPGIHEREAALEEHPLDDRPPHDVRDRREAIRR
jgi:hypothetical protein